MTTARIDTELAILGNGETIKNAAIFLEGNKITKVSGQENSHKADVNLSTPIVTPGFWDCHGHYFGLTKFDYGRLNLLFRNALFSLPCQRSIQYM